MEDRTPTEKSRISFVYVHGSHYNEMWRVNGGGHSVSMFRNAMRGSTEYALLRTGNRIFTTPASSTGRFRIVMCSRIIYNCQLDRRSLNITESFSKPVATTRAKLRFSLDSDQRHSHSHVIYYFWNIIGLQI